MALEDVYKEVNKFISESDDKLSKITTGTSIKEAISSSLVSIARQHHMMILNSVQVHNLVNPAFALIRPLVETTYRAIWIMIVASEKQAKDIGKGKTRFPSSPRPLAVEVDDKEGGVVYQTRFDENRYLLNGFTHSGLELIGRQKNGSKIEPNFTEEELVALLTESIMNYGILLFNYGKYIGNNDLYLLGGNIVQNVNFIDLLNK